MNQKFGADTLLIIPCCAAKASGGQEMGEYWEPLRHLVSPTGFAEMLAARTNVLRDLKGNSKFFTDKYSKNVAIHEGRDFGGHSIFGKYLPAIDRYMGTLYSVPGFKFAVNKTVGSEGQPQIMILSALYGPLHPLSIIQDYNLMMSDAPARTWSRSFPPFLEDYVNRNGIMTIHLYVGSATAYYRIAKEAAGRLLKKGLIKQAIQYHIVNGSTHNTPFQHGTRLLSDLAGISYCGDRTSHEIEENVLCV